MFQDITTLLLDHEAFKNAIDMFAERYEGKNISVVAGICKPFASLCIGKLVEEDSTLSFFLFVVHLILCCKLSYCKNESFFYF